MKKSYDLDLQEKDKKKSFLFQSSKISYQENLTVYAVLTTKRNC